MVQQCPHLLTRGAPRAPGHANPQVTAHGNLLVNLPAKQDPVCLSRGGGSNPSSFTPARLTEV